MKQYLKDKKVDINTLSIVPRDIDIKPNKEFISSIIGPRRAGKTYYLYYIIKKLQPPEEDYLFVNFEDIQIKILDTKEKLKIIENHIDLYGKEPKYIFLDEIQELEHWQEFLYSLYEKKRYYIFVTGSSSKLLSKEIATALRGRAISTIVFPFSFKEYLRIKNIDPKQPLSSYEKGRIKHLLKEYLNIGGFPQVVLGYINKKEFVREYIDIVLYRDLVERFGIENVQAMEYLIYSVIQSNAKEFSINKIYKQIKDKVSVGNKTLYTYSRYLEQSLFAFYLNKFDWSMKKSMIGQSKVYVNDPGVFSYYCPGDIGRQMETIVFLELKKKELRNELGLYYYKNNYEVDFLVKQGPEIKELIQVTYASEFDEIAPREYRALIKASDLFKEAKLTIVTWDYEDQKRLSWFGREAKIEFKPLWKWLLKV